MLGNVISMLDKLAKNNIIHKNKANNYGVNVNIGDYVHNNVLGKRSS